MTLDIGILDLGVEDHATNAPVAAALTEHALDLLEGILAIELDMARIVHDVTPGLAAPAPAVAAAFAASTPPARRPGSRRPPAAIHEAEAGALCHAVLEAARAAIPAG